MVITAASQATHAGSIPVARSKAKIERRPIRTALVLSSMPDISTNAKEDQKSQKSFFGGRGSMPTL